MNFSRVKIACAMAAMAMAPIMAQNVLTNGDMSYGDGGWYLWNSPDGPAKVELQLGKMGLGVMVVNTDPQVLGNRIVSDFEAKRKELGWD